MERQPRISSHYRSSTRETERTPSSYDPGLGELATACDADSYVMSSESTPTLVAFPQSGLSGRGARWIALVSVHASSSSKIESGMLDLDVKPIDLRELPDNVVLLYNAKDSERGVDLSAVLGSEGARFVKGDAVRIGQILNNFVSNAIKLTENGTVTLETRCTGFEPSQRTICFSVKDSGNGIAPEAIDRVFEEFEQADSSTTRRYGGTGLGLSISKSLCEVMNGRIWLESTVGVGSTFFFELCLEAGGEPPITETDSAEPNTKSKQAEASTESFEGLRVLVVDDNNVNLFVARSMLSKLGCDVETATDGQAALEIYQERDYELILMDCQMPVMAGFDATRVIREHEQGGTHVPIIALTAYAQREDRDECLSAGMDDFLTKPRRIETLRRVLAKWEPKSNEE